jgi:hypothetical protein
MNLYSFRGDELFMIALIFCIFSVLITFICRELVCWYFKINERLKVQKEIRDYFIGGHKESKKEK